MFPYGRERRNLLQKSMVTVAHLVHQRIEVTLSGKLERPTTLNEHGTTTLKKYRLSYRLQPIDFLLQYCHTAC
jgi:hypothetical protein